MFGLFDNIRRTKLGRKGHYIILGFTGAVLSLGFLIYDLVQMVMSKPSSTTSSITVLILVTQCLCCMASFLGYVYRSLAGRPGFLTKLSVVSVFANLVLLLLRSVMEVICSGYSEENYSETPKFENLFYAVTLPTYV